jgi:hypothetical protein
MKLDRWHIPLALLAGLLCAGLLGRYLIVHPLAITARALNLAGLVSNMVGVGLVFFYGFPQPDHNEGEPITATAGTRLPDGRTVAERDEEVRKRKRLYRCMSMLALLLMFIGFAAQAVALFC